MQQSTFLLPNPTGKFQLSLVAAPGKKQVAEKAMRYEAHVNGRFVTDLYYNVGGYVGYLPLPDGQRLDIGCVGVGRIRKEVAAINRSAEILKVPFCYFLGKHPGIEQRKQLWAERTGK
jgi:hypothetical protein